MAVEVKFEPARPVVLFLVLGLLSAQAELAEVVAVLCWVGLGRRRGRRALLGWLPYGSRLVRDPSGARARRQREPVHNPAQWKIVFL